MTNAKAGPARLNRVRLVSLTKPIDPNHNAESLIAYCARVSSPKQDNPEYDKLLKYCMKHGHWSVFEMADMCVEITTSRAIAQQIIRHRSFCFQEFSQRYSESKFGYVPVTPRRQDEKNRQNSIDDLSYKDKGWFLFEQGKIWQAAYQLYKEALGRGIAKECARMLLPLSTGTKLYMKGSIRSWLHYCETRCHKSTQLEHREIADECKRILIEQFPSIGEMLEASEEE